MVREVKARWGLRSRIPARASSETSPLFWSPGSSKQRKALPEGAKHGKSEHLSIPAGSSQKMKTEKVKNYNADLPLLAVFNVCISIAFAHFSLFMSVFLVPLMFMGLWASDDLDFSF